LYSPLRQNDVGSLMLLSQNLKLKDYLSDSDYEAETLFDAGLYDGAVYVCH